MLQSLKDMIDEANDTSELMSLIQSDRKVNARIPKVLADVILTDLGTLRRMVDQLVRDKRNAFRKEPAEQPRTTGDTEQGKQKRMDGFARYQKRWQDWIWRRPICGGKLLKDCRRSDLARSVAEYQRLIKGNELAAEFERRVHDTLPNGMVTVGGALTAEQLHAIYHDVYGFMKEAAE